MSRPSTVAWRSIGSRRARSASTSLLSDVRRRPTGPLDRPLSRTHRSGGHGRRRAQVGDARPAPARRGDRVPARDVVAVLGEPLEPAVGDGDPPQLVRAVDRGAEVRASGRPSTRRAACPRRGSRRCSCPSPASGREGRTGCGPRPASRRRRPRRTATRRSGCRRRPPVRCPSAAIVRPSGSQAGAKKLDRGPRVTAVTARVLDVDDVDVLVAAEQVGITPPVRDEGDPAPVRVTRPAPDPRPGHRSGGWPRRSPRRPATGAAPGRT